MVGAAGEQLSEATEPQSKQRTEVSVTEECPRHTGRESKERAYLRK